jgi:predicted site-specific integrase-resolvase
MVHTDVLSTGQVLEELKITKQTLYKWIMLRRIKAITHEIGRRVFLEFDPKEIARVKSAMKKEREAGKSLLKDL